ncbi:hypothetical protein K3495_g7021 [Podosphaera aphanis]|nr:hypothetical protein K3495_g7021 [Podosphaera aphanis]
MEKPKESDVEKFKQALVEKFPKRFAGNMKDGNVQEDIQNLKQREGETFMAYHERAQDLLCRSNGRDDECGARSELSALEKTMLSIIVKAFIRGIRDDNLRSMVMMKSTIFHGSLQGAYEKSKKTMESVKQRDDIEKERLERMELDHFREQYQQQWGRPLSVAVAGMAHRGSQGNAYQQPKPYQNGGRCQSPDARMPIKEQPSSNGRGGYAGRGIEMGGSGGQKTVPPKNLSRHPIINGSQKYDRGMGSLCLSCGTLGHRRPECNGKPLQFWEQGYLKDILNQSLSSNFSGFGADQRGLRYRDIENSNWRPKDDERLIEGGARRQAQEPARERQIESDMSHLTYEEYNGIQSSNESTKLARCMSVVIGFVRNIVTQPIPAATTNLSHWTDTHPTFALPRKDCFGSLHSMDIDTCPRHNSLFFTGFDGKMQESRQESSIEDSLDMLTLESNLNEGNTRKRARPMDIHNNLNEDEQEVKMKKSSKRERRTKKPLREIVGRLGKGPVNYKNMAEDIRVNLSLMELFQISPHLSKAFRTLSTRVNDRTMKERMRTELRKEKEKADLASNSEVLYGTAASSSEVPSEKAFRIPVEVKTEKDG